MPTNTKPLMFSLINETMWQHHQTEERATRVFAVMAGMGSVIFSATIAPAATTEKTHPPAKAIHDETPVIQDRTSLIK